MSGPERQVKFELNPLVEVNRDTIAAELRRVALSSGLTFIPAHRFKQLGGRVGLTTIRRHFGGWEQALKYAGLEDKFSGTPGDEARDNTP
jgi:hypothetical protein